MSYNHQFRFSPRNIIWIFVFTVLIVSYVVFVIAQALIQPVYNVEVNGANHLLTQKQIKQLFAKHNKNDFLKLSVHELKHDILQLPWVISCRVAKEWPGKIKINITERQPLAWLNTDSIVDQSGAVFKPECLTHYQEIPIIIANTKNGSLDPAILTNYKLIKQELEQSKLHIRQCEINDASSWIMRLSNGILLNIGDKDLLGRVRRFNLAYQGELKDKQNNIKQVDLRYEHGFAIAWKSNQNKIASNSFMMHNSKLLPDERGDKTHA